MPNIKRFHRVPLTLGSALAIALALSACSVESTQPFDTTDSGDWPTYGGDYAETHASQLTEISPAVVGRLGLAWSMDLPDVHNGGTTPLAVDGVLYFTIDQSIVRAVDAATGKQLWIHDPKVAEVAGQKLRFGWGPRGIAYGYGKIYVGTTDGRLIALDAKTGDEVWSAQTTGKDDARYISGAARVFDGLVLIGHGGADYNAMRGYVTAYDAQTGKQVWRFHTVPGDPAKGFENKAMELAAKTWNGEWWKVGGGGTVWNAMTYDPKYDVVYIGTGNGSPWNQAIRSPGGGDNLFLCSIVALDAKTGEYRWHYQVNPGEEWDFNAAMDITLATLTIGGKPHDVLMQAPKNGFFYVINRATGKLISAEKFGKVTWAERIDLKTGRPVEAAATRYGTGSTLIWPGSIGAHNWQAQSYNADTGLVYLPTMEMPGYYDATGINPKAWKPLPGRANLGLTPYTGEVSIEGTGSRLVAWNPVTQKEAWSVRTPGVWNGGTMTTGSGLVFQGQADGFIRAYDARTGKELWSFDAQMGITGAPITFTAAGKQMVAVVAGWGGAGAAYLGPIGAQHGWDQRRDVHRLLVFALDGNARLPVRSEPLPVLERDPAIAIDRRKAASAAPLWVTTCSICHGGNAVASGHAPDLRHSPVPMDSASFRAVLKEGLLVARGMPKYDDLSDEEIEGLRHYILSRPQ